MKFILLYLLLINAVSFVFMRVDKQHAKKKLRRTPERTLMLLAMLGGSIGVFVGMYLLRHKTLHRKFTIGVPIIFLVQFFIAFMVFTRFGA